MRAYLIIIFQVRQQYVTEVPLSEHNNVVKAFPSDRTDKRDCRHDEQIHRGDAVGVIVEECLPSLGRRAWPPGHILGHTRLPDFDAELEQLSMDPRRSP